MLRIGNGLADISVQKGSWAQRLLMAQTFLLLWPPQANQEHKGNVLTTAPCTLI